MRGALRISLRSRSKASSTASARSSSRWAASVVSSSTHGVEERLGALGGVDRLGLVDRGDGGDPDVGGVGDRVDGALERGQPLAEVGPQREHRAPDRAHLAGQGVGIDDVRVGRLGHRLSLASLRIVSATSANAASMGASGLCTVTRDPFNTTVREADVRDPLGQGLDQVDRVGLDGGLHPGHEASVVDRVLQVVARPPRDGCRGPG